MHEINNQNDIVHSISIFAILKLTVGGRADAATAVAVAAIRLLKHCRKIKTYLEFAQHQQLQTIPRAQTQRTDGAVEKSVHYSAMPLHKIWSRAWARDDSVWLLQWRSMRFRYYYEDIENRNEITRNEFMFYRGNSHTSIHAKLHQILIMFLHPCSE